MPGEMLLLHQAAKMVLQRVAAHAYGADRVRHRDAAVLADVVDYLEVQFGAAVRRVPCVWRSAR